MTITHDYLLSRGFQLQSLGYSLLLAPACEGAAITELTVYLEPDDVVSLTLSQGFPDEPNGQDDHVVLTSLPPVLSAGQMDRLLNALKGITTE